MRIPTREEQARYGNLNAHDTQRFNVQERTPNMQLQINADMFGAGQARAMGQGAQELQRGARQIAHWYNKNEEVKGEDNYNKLLQEANEGLYGKEGILMQKGAAGKDAAVNAEKFLTSLSDKYLQGLSDVAQQSFMDRTQRFANHTMTRAHVHAAEEDRANTINIHDASMASAKDNALRNAANPEAFNDYAAQYMQALTLKEQVLGSPQEKIDMKRKEGLSGLYMDKVQGLIVGGDLKGARAAVNVGGMLEQDKMRALGVIKQEEKRIQAEARANAALKMQDIRDSLQDQELMASQTGNITPLVESAEKLKALGNTHGAAALLKKAEIYGNNYAAIEKVQSLPLPDGVKYLEEIDTKLKDASSRGDSAVYGALAHERTVVAKSLQGIVKGLQDDPAKAVSNSVIGDTPARIAESRMNAQSQHGLPLGARRVLTNAEATKFSTEWREGDLQKKMSVVNVLQEYGTYSGRAAQEVGIGPAEQLAMQNAMDDPPNLPNLTSIITASNTKSEDLPKLEKAESLTATTVADSKLMKVYAAASRVMPGNASLLSNVRQMEKTIGNLLRMNGGNTEAALKAFDGTMDSIVDTNMSVAFNPRRVGSGDMEEGLKEAMQEDLESFLAGRNYNTPYEKNDYLYHLRKSGMWINAPDGRGYILIDPVSQAPVMREDGHTFRRTNADILNYKEGRQPMDPYEIDDMLMDTLP